MLDFGWAELFVVMAVAVFAIGPNELPGLMRSLGRIMRRIQYMKHSLSAQFDDFMDAEGLNEAVNFEARAETDADFDEAAEDEDEDILPPKKEASHE